MIFMASTPGQKLQEVLGGEIGSLFLLACTAFSLYYLWQRAFTKFLGFAMFAMLVGVFVFSPTFIREFGTDAFQFLFEDWMK